jgi:hypothetical protein
LLRGVLQQDPDVILIGEIRDAVTAETAAHAANSGHLVLATLYAPHAAGAVQRMRGWGVNLHFLGNTLLGLPGSLEGLLLLFGVFLVRGGGGGEDQHHVEGGEDVSGPGDLRVGGGASGLMILGRNADAELGLNW